MAVPLSELNLAVTIPVELIKFQITDYLWDIDNFLVKSSHGAIIRRGNLASARLCNCNPLGIWHARFKALGIPCAADFERCVEV